jgi:phosphate transport system substrate-binding protein
MKSLISVFSISFLISLFFTLPAQTEDNTLTWAGCGITKKAFMAELAAAYEKKTGVKIVLEGGGATRGIQDASAMKIDMGGSCRMPLPEFNETELHANMYPVAWDALVVIVHPQNPINSLSTLQVKEIYTGSIRNWQQLGGHKQDIRLYAREGKYSGVGYALRQYLFQDIRINFNNATLVKSSGPLEKAVERDINAIGITGVSSAHKRKVKILSLDGREPSFENVKSGNYGLYRPLYLVTGPSPSRKVMDFIEFAMSREGAQIIRSSGTVPYRDGLHLSSKSIIYGFGVKN